MPTLGYRDRLVLALVRWWCMVRHVRWWCHTVRMTGVRPNPATPASDVEKFLWRKIFDHNPLFTMACDKIAAKEYARSVCPGLKTAEILWVGSDPDQIPVDVIAGNVVVKSNHGAGRYLMVHDGQVDRRHLRRSASLWLNRGFGVGRGEWGYRNVDRRIFVERMLLEDGVPISSEYKFAVCCGRTAYVFIARKLAEGDIQQFHTDRDGRVQSKSTAADPRLKHFTVPACFARMRQFAEKVSAPFDFVRCDLYELNGEVYFSEFAVYPQSGRTSASDELKNLRNALWDLRRSWFLTTPQSGWRRTYAAALSRWLKKASPPPS